MSSVRLGALCRRLSALTLLTIAVSATAQPFTYEHLATPRSLSTVAYPMQMAVGPDGSLYVGDIQARLDTLSRNIRWMRNNDERRSYDCECRDGLFHDACFSFACPRIFAHFVAWITWRSVSLSLGAVIPYG